MDNTEEAIKKATAMTKTASKDVPDLRDATIFCVYDENGKYLGGDLHSKH
jgi:hypothetical protein